MDNLGDRSVYPPQVKSLASKISSKLIKLSPYSKHSSKISIFKVPEKYRNKNKEAYTPRLVSIGLIHHDESQLKATERQKLEYLNHFLTTFQIPLECLVEFAQVHEKAVCGSYDDIYSRKLEALEPKVEPSEVILLDGIFVVTLLLKNHYREMRDNGDAIFDNPWVAHDVLHDMMLIENQLPLWFLSSLYETYVLKDVIKGLVAPPTFMGLVHKYFQEVGHTRKLPMERDVHEANTLVEFLLLLHLDKYGSRLRETKVTYRFHELSKLDLAKSDSATQLKARGVNFRESGGCNFLDVSFTTGRLCIPTLTVNDSTETFLHNLIAIEQTSYKIKYITSYVILMGSFIKTHKDVDLLIEFGIIRNMYGSSAKVAKLFCDLYTELALDPQEFYYAYLRENLNEYSRGWWYKCRALLTKTPLIQAISIATVVGTVLGVIQTVCSVLQVTSAK